MNRRMYLIKIVLDEIEPAIWRRFIVPSDIPLDRLHDVIQIIMGWLDNHLHEFVVEGKCYTEDPDPDMDDDAIKEESYLLSDLVNKSGTQFEHAYDFGDRWRHQLVLENDNYKLGKFETPIACLDGNRACPPEDVGGVPGYFDFCEAISDIEHPQHAELKEWYEGHSLYEGSFESEHFNLEKVNLGLSMYLRWSRHRMIPWTA